MPPGLADKTLPRKVLGRFGIGLAFAFAVALLVAFAFLAFAILAFAFAQPREIHGCNITKGRIRLCSVIVKQHRPELRIALQDV